MAILDAGQPHVRPTEPAGRQNPSMNMGGLHSPGEWLSQRR